VRKFETAKGLVPAPVVRPARRPTDLGVVYFGSTAPAMSEALDLLDRRGVDLDALRLRAFPFSDRVGEFVRAHTRVFVVEQNRDAQVRSLLAIESGVEAERLVPVLHYDGTPITARFIADAIEHRLAAATPGDRRQEVVR